MPYVITGGPCTGKTTLLRALHAAGHPVVPETAREIIEEQQASGGTLLPWLRLRDFQIALVKRQTAKESMALPGSFLDRGVPDGAAYCIAGGIAVPRELEHACVCSAYDAVFLLDMLAYRTDTVRIEDEPYAALLHASIGDVYRSLGHAVIRVPVLPVPERAAFVLGALEKKGSAAAHGRPTPV